MRSVDGSAGAGSTSVLSRGEEPPPASRLSTDADRRRTGLRRRTTTHRTDVRQVRSIQACIRCTGMRINRFPAPDRRFGRAGPHYFRSPAFRRVRDSRGNGNKDVVQNENSTGINVTGMGVAFSQRHLQSSYIISNFRFLHT